MELKHNQAFAVMNTLSETLVLSIANAGFLKEEDFEISIPWLEDTVRKQFISLCEVLEIDNIEE